MVTEGKTDIIYIRAAIKALQAQFPRLVKAEGDRFELSVRFLNSSTVNQRVLNLGAGFGGMKDIIGAYDARLKPYECKPLTHPVIFIIDNDDGGESVLRAAAKISKQNITPTSTDAFFHVYRNLYLVKTPVSDGIWSTIEDCFPEMIRDQTIDGKPFDPKKKHGDETSFGKTIFAEKIVRPGVNTINFSGFKPILDGVSGSIVDWTVRTKKAATQVAAKSA